MGLDVKPPGRKGPRKVTLKVRLCNFRNPVRAATLLPLFGATG
ncbi:hypothetical protein KSF_090030 [Reticulibacter mediterranei]|uniref:Uncharacterized protein n=1 Tax=Reticulibacter mediterranei TaxID=2778369 RepID=A0A8J3IY86_9CHLR|nr:hypothetical protein [Reticulibacter mediterranei]GHO98955.1 hypothetical protein KSF_090030 [Reticulibacter mediterranei]